MVDIQLIDNSNLIDGEISGFLKQYKNYILELKIDDFGFKNIKSLALR